MTVAQISRVFTFSVFHHLTPDLLGHERAAVFGRLPPELQQEAWRDLQERTRARNHQLFREMRDEC